MAALFFVFFTSLLLSFFLPEPMVPGPGLQLLVPETGLVPKQQKNATVSSNSYVRIPKVLIGWMVFSPHLA